MLYLRWQWNDQEVMFGREILKFTGEVGARKTFGNFEHRGHRLATGVDDITCDRSQHFPSNLQLKPGWG